MKKANYIYKFILIFNFFLEQRHVAMTTTSFFIPDQSQFQLFVHLREKGSGVVKGVKGVKGGRLQEQGD